MRLSATYRGGDDPFEGERVVELRALPAGALVQRATLTVTPTNAAPAAPLAPFEERFVFGPARAGELAAVDWGVTATAANSSVEVDLHARRTLASVGGARIAGSALTVDVGGLYVELNENGAVRAPDDNPFAMAASGALPGVTVPGFRLTRAAAPAPALDTVVVRSGPANVTVGLAGLGPFWTHVGDLAVRQTTPDFAETLRTFLLEAEARDGVYVLAFVVHADGVARLDLELQLEFLHGRSLLPAGLPEAVLPFDLSTFARSGSAALSVRLPAGAAVVAGATRARVQGAFEATRIAADAGTDPVAPAAGTSITAQRAAAQALQPAAGDILATGFDVCLAPLGPAARLSLSLLADSDGKPFGAPLLRAPLEVELSREQGRAAAWITVTLGEPFHLERGRRYWLVAQALEGEASWGAVAAGAADVALQASADGGLSWTLATDARLPGPLTALHRLRITPERFTMPISLDVGEEHVTLEEFEPLQRIDFTVDTPKLAQAFDAAIAAAGAQACATGEHLANAGLDDWIGVGDELSPGTSLDILGSARALALSPDGRKAYVASVAGVGGDLRVLLETVPLACDVPVGPIVLETGEGPSQPVLVAVGSAGERAYVLGDDDGVATLAITDLSAGVRVGNTIDLDPVRGLAVAPDGERLLLLSQLGEDVVIDAVDTRTIDRAAVEGSGVFTAARPHVATISLNDNEQVAPGIPAAFAASAAGGETLLAFAVEDLGSTGLGAARLLFFSEERPAEVSSVPIGPGPRALAMTDDGRRIVVACAGDGTLRVIATDAPAGPEATSIALDSPPMHLALSADGTRAAVLMSAGVVVVDLDSGRRITGTTVALEPVAVAGSARLDVILAARSAGSSLARLTTDAVPVDWVLTSGFVEPRCLDGNLGALLGRARASRKSAAADGDPEPRVASAISQVVPVSGGCRYEFSFLGRADQPASAGEVLWRAGDCGLARADRVPITEIDRTARDRGEDSDTLVLHRVTLEAPPGTTQAELRFTVPTGGVAAIGSVSLRGSDAVGSNEDFREQADGALGGWTADPAGAVLATAVAGDAGGARIANETAVAGSLVQSLPVTGGRPLVIELAGRVTATGEDPGPALELQLLDAAGAAAGEPVAVALSRHGFDRVVLAADVPAPAVRAQVRIALPAGAAVQLERVASRQPSEVDVPVTPRAQAPGELAVSGAEVVYDVRPPSTPALPATGVCTPTAPGSVPGADPAGCACCCADHELHTAKARVVRRAPVRMLARGAGMPREAALAIRPVTEVSGIGAARARGLALVGISTLERLAAADARVVAIALGGGMSDQAARGIIGRARDLVTRLASGPVAAPTARGNVHRGIGGPQ